MNRMTNNTIANLIAKTGAAFFVLSAACILSCEIPTDGGFSGSIRGRSVPLAAPKNVRAAENGDNGTITITWDEVPEADGYNVYRSKGASPQVSLRGGVSRTEYPDSGKSVAPNTPYYYFVSAYKGEAESAMSPSGMIELSAGASGILAAPEITGADPAGGADSIRLTWTEVQGAAEYRIYRSSSYDDKQYIFKHKGTETTYDDANLMPGEYTYQVSAVNADGQEGYLSRSSDWVEIESDEDTSLSVPSAPQNVRAKIGDPLSITLAWQAVADATRYYVMRSEDGETYTEIGYTEGETSYINSGTAASPVSRGGIYYYRVKPYNGSRGGYLSQACGPVIVTPAKPVFTGASGTAYNLTISWTIEGNADGFRVYRSINNSQYEIVKTAAGNERTYTDTDAGQGTYYYRIVAYNSGGEGLESDIKTVNVAELEKTPFVPVTGITGVPDTAQVGVPLDLQGAVQPSGATNKAITWAVKTAGGTGASISGNTLTTTAAGTVTLTATIAGGLAPGSAYTRDFTITVSPPFVPVTGITGVPDTAQAGVPLDLQGTVQPSGATNKAITWAVKNAGGTGASISGNTLTTTAAGTVTLTATIAGGLASGNYARDFTITVSLNTIPFNAANSAAFASALSSIGSSGGDHFTVTVGADMSLAPQDLTLPAYADKTIVLKGDTPARTLSLSSAGSLFTVGEDVTLVLENITLKGRADNNVSLVTVDGGAMVMEDGAKVTGNTFNCTGPGVANAGGIGVASGALTMNGGEISNNTFSLTTTTGNGGNGGVTISAGASFTMNGGKISNNHASAVYSDGLSGGVGADTFTMNGGEISGNTVSKTHFNGQASGGVSAGNFVMTGGVITNNHVEWTAQGRGGASGGVLVGGTFTMTSGEISANTTNATFATGGGVYCMYDATFVCKKTGGVIYGTGAPAGKANTVSGGTPNAVRTYQNAFGTIMRVRNSTAGENDDLDTDLSGAAGGWE